ncbi:AlbA family DNA-binding domain-containing protein [Nocardia amamiensis]|uniref:AlbA family DNA-binding domain-containing protein n=1 Tax=Nocardia amamiensis TaxID=404578 RepID=UPI0008324176|nr:ATP-binding protein [Nocardia amamiensis]
MSTVDLLWNPRTEVALRQAAADGLLEESHELDIKRQLESGESANKKIACDIAAFALDGGIIVIGVDEDTSPPSLWPVELDGLAERIESIAATAVHESVRIQTTVIEATDAPGRGYLIVRVPQSPRAPHMVDGRYYGRGDKENRVLSHAEVLRLHERQLTGRKDILAEARRAITNLGRQHEDPILAVVAEPLGAPDNLLVPLTDSAGWQNTVHELVRTAATPDNLSYRPNLLSSPGFGRRAHAVAITTGLSEDRGWEGQGRAAELAFRENGTLVLISERAVVTENRYGHPSAQPRIFETLILGHADLLVRVAAAVAQQYGFTGTWQFGLVLTGIRNATSLTLDQDIMAGYGAPYTDDSYERTTEAALLDLTHNPRATVKALTGALLRSLAAHHRWESFFTE